MLAGREEGNLTSDPDKRQRESHGQHERYRNANSCSHKGESRKAPIHPRISFTTRAGNSSVSLSLRPSRW